MFKLLQVIKLIELMYVNYWDISISIMQITLGKTPAE